MAAAIVGFINDEYVLNPSFEELKNSDLDMVVAGSESAVLMVESDELSEDLMIGAILYGHQEMKPVIKAIHDFSNEVLPKELSLPIRQKRTTKKYLQMLKKKQLKALKMLSPQLDKKERGEN